MILISEFCPIIQDAGIPCIPVDAVNICLNVMNKSQLSCLKLMLYLQIYLIMINMIHGFRSLCFLN
jgi:hypothetical protein